MPGQDDRSAHRLWGGGRAQPGDLTPEEEEEAAGPGGPAPDVVVRALSVVPLLLVAALGLIGVVSWVLIILFGLGAGEPVWRAAQGLSAGELLSQLLLAVLIGLAPLLVTLAASWATARGFREDAGRTFWTVTQGLWGLAGLGLIYVRQSRHDLVDDLGFSATDWWFAFGVVAFAMILAGVRLRRAPRSRPR